MAGLAKTAKKVKKAKKHGVKAGQKSLIRPSQKKAVKNGRYQEKQTPKNAKAKIAKAVSLIPAGLDGTITDDECEVYPPEHDLPFGDLAGDCVDEEADDDLVFDDYLEESEGTEEEIE